MSIFRRLWNVVRRSRLDDEIRKEFDSHLALLEDEERARGLSVHEARQRARFRFGNSLAHRERAMDAVIATWLDTIRQDIGFACRQLGRRPGFSTIAMLTMALGIGVNVTAFTALNAVTLRLLPIRNAARAVRVERWFESGSRGNGQYFFSYPEYRYLRD
jgi:hypothetical protein